MSQESTSIHGMWSSRWAFILAATGSAVGLGNIWKFPYIAGEYGGGAFVLVYLFCIVLVGVPILCSEILLGRMGRESPANTFAKIAKSIGASPLWKGVGWLGVTAGFLILSFYSVVAGWACAYVYKAVMGHFDGQNAENIGNMFSGLLASPGQNIGWTTLVIALTMFVVGRGVNRGLEKAVSTLMPGMFVILIIMVGYAMTTGHFQQALGFMFNPDFSKLSAEGVLVALGHAFFTLSLASGIMLMYGAYLPDNVSLVRTGITIAIADTVVALMAGAAIFPIVFANSLEPGAGPGLVFVTLPIAFGQMPFGLVIGSLFFLMLVFAAFTSAISLIESVVAWLVEHKGLSRPFAATLAGVAVWLVSIGPALSSNIWSDVLFGGKNIFDLLDFVTANIFLPLCGLLISIFVGWKLTGPMVAEQLSLSHDSAFFTGFRFIVKIFAPIAITLVFLQNLGVFDALLNK